MFRGTRTALPSTCGKPRGELDLNRNKPGKNEEGSIRTRNQFQRGGKQEVVGEVSKFGGERRGILWPRKGGGGGLSQQKRGRGGDALWAKGCQ